MSMFTLLSVIESAFIRGKLSRSVNTSEGRLIVVATAISEPSTVTPYNGDLFWWWIPLLWEWNFILWSPREIVKLLECRILYKPSTSTYMMFTRKHRPTLCQWCWWICRLCRDTIKVLLFNIFSKITQKHQTLHIIIIVLVLGVCSKWMVLVPCCDVRRAFTEVVMGQGMIGGSQSTQILVL